MVRLQLVGVEIGLEIKLIASGRKFLGGCIGGKGVQMGRMRLFYWLCSKHFFTKVRL